MHSTYLTEHGSVSILLIEDNPGDARLIKEYLKESILRLQSAVHVEETLEAGTKRLQNEDFDIILLDLALPDSFGLDTFEKVNRAAVSVPIIVLTGLDDEQVGVEAVQHGAQDFLIKKELNASLLGRSTLYAIQRSRLSQQLERSQERLKQAQQLAHLGSFEQDLRSGKLIWSEEIYRLLELDPQKKLPSYESYLEMVHPEDWDRVERANEKVHQEEKRQYVEYRVNLRGGQTKHLYSILDPVKNREGVVVKIFGTTLDITRQKKAEQQLRENERRYRTLFQVATDEILVFQLDDNNQPEPFLEVNDTACDMLGYSRDELLQKSLYDIVAAEKQELDRRIDDAINYGETVLESRHLTKEGDRIPLELSIRSFTYNGRQTIISVGRDLRERRKLEQEILNVSEQERQRIGRDMHDDLGQLLSVATLTAQLVGHQMKSKDMQEAKKVQEIADMVKTAGEHARILSHGLVPANIELNGLDSALEELISNVSNMYDIDIHYAGSQDNVLEDNSSAVHVYRIAQEAINNAVKHGNATSIEVELSSCEDHISLRIKDDGSGFPGPEAMSEGVGLRTMNFRANMIGGDLKINSERGEGTEIICQIPKTSL